MSALRKEVISSAHNAGAGAAEPAQLRSPRIVFLLAVLAVAAYAPFLSFPFLANSFIEIPVSRLLASMSGFHLLITNANWHFRITYALINSLLEQWFGFQPRVFYAASLALHAICVLLVYGLGRWRLLPSGAALWAAGFLAVYQGHHGAIVSLASWPDLITSLFGAASLLCWIRWLQGDSKLSYAFSLVWYFAAIISNESGFIVVLLLAVPLAAGTNATKRKWLSVVPFVALAMIAVAIQLAFRPRELDWNNSLPALDPWWLTLAWTGALLALAVLMRLREKQRLLFACTGWILVTLLVDLYLTRMLKLPGGTSYLASLGLALLFGMVFSAITARLRPSLAAAVALLVVGGNIALLWSVSRRQLLGFAAPTQTLIAAASFAQGPIELSCFPYPLEVAQAAVGWLGAQIAEPKPGQIVRKPHCVSFRYRDSTGSVRQVFLHSAI